MDKWPRIPVRDLCLLIVDCVNRTAPVVERPTPYRMIRTTNVRNGRIDLSSCKYVDEATYDRWTRRAKVLDGDIILTREAPIGEVGFVNNLGPVFLGQRIMQYRPDPTKVSPRYLYYAFRSSELQHQFGSHEGSGSVVSHIRVADCHEFKVPLPPRQHQDGIAELVGSLDDKIELNRRMNETLEAIAQAIFHDWFVDFGPTRRKLAGITDPIEIMGGLAPDPARAAELAPGLPEALDNDGLPVGWSRRPFTAFVDVISGGTPKTTVSSYWGGDIPWFSVVDTPPNGDVFVRSTEKSITAQGLAESAARLVLPETTIISARGTVGNLAIAAREMAFNQSCYALRAQAPVGNYFVYLAARRLVDHLKSMAHGSVFSTITRDTFERVDFPYPGREALAQFENIVGVLFTKIASNGAECEILAATRDLLLPKLMSGEIRLRDAENAVAEAGA